MTETSTAISEKSDDLERFAEKRLQAAETSELMAGVPSLVQRGGIYLISGAVCLTFLVLFFGKVNIVVPAKGKIIPEGDVQLVQALQSGVVNAVLAHAGDRLTVGAPILRLDVSESGISLAEMKRKAAIQSGQLAASRQSGAEIDAVLARPDTLRARATAAVSGPAVQIIGSLENAQMRLDSAQRDLGRLPEKKQLQTRQMDVTREKTSLLEKNHTTGERLLAAQESGLAEKKEQLTNLRGLADRKLISPVELSAEEEKYRAAESAQLNARQSFEQQEIDISNERLHLTELQTKLQTEQAEAESALRAAQAAFNQALASLRQERENVRVQVQEAESSLESLRAKIAVSEQHMSLAAVTMPVAGTLAEVKVKNTGELVNLGSVVAAVVPEGVPLIVEAEVPSKDVGFVRVGLPARVKVDAYPFQQFGTARAEVTQVLPALGGHNNFTVKLRLLEDRLSSGGSPVILFPGLGVEAELLTAKQRLIQLLSASGSKDENGAKGK